MALPQSQVSRGTGIDVKYVPKAGGSARSLPQRIAVIAQGETGVSVLPKFQVTGGPKEVGSKAGYKSPAYLILRELYPVNGGGVGGIPVDLIMLGEGGTASAGDITPSASAVAKPETHTAVIAGVRGLPFTIPAASSVAAADISDWLESLRQSIENKLGMPVNVAHEYGSPAATPDGDNTGDGTVSATVSSAPKAGTWTVTCTAAATDAGTFAVVDPDGFTVGTVTAGGGATVVAGLSITITDGTADWVVGDSAAIEVPSTKLNVTAAWKGASGDDIDLEIESPADSSVTWAFTQPTGGATNPTVDAALAQIGDVWNTLVINALEPGDSTAWNTYQAYVGDPDDETGRWAPKVRKPLAVFTGATETTVAAATAYTNGRTTDLANHLIPVPGSPNLPCVIAAAAVREIAKLANDNPPHDYGSLRLTTITPGTDAEAWDGDARELAVTRGCSTTRLRDGVVELSDVVSCYKPAGEDPPAYRFFVDQVKNWNAIYNFALVFDSAAWDGKPLIADGQATVNPEARTVASAVGAMNAVLDSLALSAIIADAKAAKAASSVTLSGTNPKRLDIVPVYDVAGNTNIKAITLKWSFFFG